MVCTVCSKVDVACCTVRLVRFAVPAHVQQLSRRVHGVSGVTVGVRRLVTIQRAPTGQDHEVLFGRGNLNVGCTRPHS